MFTELLSFWTKYRYHILIGIILYIFLKLSYEMLKKGTIFTQNKRHNFNILDNTMEQLKGNDTIILLLPGFKFFK